MNHGIADEMNAAGGAALTPQILNPARLGDKKDVREMIGENAILFFRHGAIEGPQAGLNVHNQRPRGAIINGKLRRREGARNCRIDVAYDDQDIRALLNQDLFELAQNLRSLSSMRATAYAKVDIRPRELEVSEKLVGHGLVVMLSGVHQGVLDRCRSR